MLSELELSLSWPILGIFSLFIFSLLYYIHDDGGPPRLSETIPFFSNTLELATDPKRFWTRTLQTMQSLNTDIIRFRLNFHPVYVIIGEAKTNILFRPPLHTGLSAKRYFDAACEAMFEPTARDRRRFVSDTTGFDPKKPVPGTEHVPDMERVWMRYHHSLQENLHRAPASTSLTNRFFTQFTARMAELFPLGESKEVLIWELLHRHQTEIAGRALAGNLIFDMNPGYLEATFQFELAVMQILFGPPRWLRPEPYRIREAVVAMHRRWMEKALALSVTACDRSVLDSDSSSEWDPVFGSSLIKSMVRWGLEVGFDRDTIAGLCGFQILAANSNSIPAAAWAVMGALTCPDPDLLPNLQREAEAAAAVVPDDDDDDDTTGKRSLDVQRLTSANAPWLQAVYTEVLRMRLVFILIRDAERDTTIGEVHIPKGATVKAPMMIAHYNEVWAMEGHPPEEFWPARHLRDAPDGKKKEFHMGRERSGYFFPYGGGNTICPGRGFARQQIVGTVAMFLTQFHVEVMGWVGDDGKPSEREARSGVGMITAQPDRDLKLRVVRK